MKTSNLFFTQLLTGLIVVSWFVLTSCTSHQETETEEVSANSPGDSYKSAAEEAEVPKKKDWRDTIVFDERYFPSDSVFVMDILTPGTFHSDEVWPEAADQSWMGLFLKGDSYYLQETKVKIPRVFDPLLDSEEKQEKTGWKVTSDHADSCVLLISKLKGVPDRKVLTVNLYKDEIYPGDTLSFSFLGINYQLYATGGMQPEDEEPRWPEMWNYKLFLVATIDGVEKKELLVAVPNFSDNMINVLFAGDIDGDAKLDLFIDTSRHSAGRSPTLYLSKPAESGHLVKVVGMHETVGC